MIGFRNIAVHEYQRLQLAVTEHVILHRLEDFQQLCRILLREQQS